MQRRTTAGKHDARQCFAAIIRRKSMKREGLSSPLPSSSWSMPPMSPSFMSPAPTARAPRSGPCPSGRSGKQQLADSSTMDDAVQKYLNLTSYYGQQVEMDNQARILAAPDPAQHGQAGRGSHGFRQDDLPGSAQPGDLRTGICRPTQLTAEDRKAMAAILRRKS